MNDNTDDEFEVFEDSEEGFEDELYTVLDDDTREELYEMMDMEVVEVSLWEDSIGDDEETEPITPENRTCFDCDILFDGGLVLELYVASLYPDVRQGPLQGMDQIEAALNRLPGEGLKLIDFQPADEEGGLALAFGKGENVQLVLTATAWMVSEWEEEGEEKEEDSEEEI